MSHSDSLVRAIFRSFPTKGGGSVFFKVLYPAKAVGDKMENSLGLFRGDTTRAPFPCVLFLNGMNCSPHGYQWLAERLVSQGYVVLLPFRVSDILPGVEGLNPGIDFDALRPDIVGTKPSCPAIEEAFQLLELLNKDGVLKDCIDKDSLFVGGGRGYLLRARDARESRQHCCARRLHSRRTEKRRYNPQIALT